jgi:hypothetical protein
MSTDFTEKYQLLAIDIIDIDMHYKCIDIWKNKLDIFDTILNTFIKIFFYLIFLALWWWLFYLFKHGVEYRIILDILGYCGLIVGNCSGRNGGLFVL